MLEAICGTNMWAEKYVKNPFIYVTDTDIDFEGEKGQQLLNYFKKQFYTKYQEYHGVIEAEIGK